LVTRYTGQIDLGSYQASRSTNEFRLLAYKKEIALMTEVSAPDSLRFSFDVDAAHEDYVTTRLVEFNKPFASPFWQNPPQPRAPLQIYVTDTHEGIIGGLIGRTNAIPLYGYLPKARPGEQQHNSVSHSSQLYGIGKSLA